MKLFRTNGYKTYFVTGGGQDFVRAYSEQVYGIPPEQVVGSAGGTRFGYDKSGRPMLTKEPKLLLNDARAPRRRHARVRLRAEVEGRHLPGRADGPGEEAGLGRDQHEERLEADLRVRGKVKDDAGASARPETVGPRSDGTRPRIARRSAASSHN